MIESRMMRWTGNVARMGTKRNAYRILTGNSEGKRPLKRPRRKWVHNIKWMLAEIEWGGMDWTDLTEDRDQWMAPVNMVMTNEPSSSTRFSVAKRLAASREGNFLNITYMRFRHQCINDVIQLLSGLPNRQAKWVCPQQTTFHCESKFYIPHQPCSASYVPYCNFIHNSIVDKLLACLKGMSYSPTGITTWQQSIHASISTFLDCNGSDKTQSYTTGSSQHAKNDLLETLMVNCNKYERKRSNETTHWCSLLPGTNVKESVQNNSSILTRQILKHTPSSTECGCIIMLRRQTVKIQLRR
jgi:hypothetical protein